MALQSSGVPISMYDIATEFNGSAPSAGSNISIGSFVPGFDSKVSRNLFQFGDSGFVPSGAVSGGSSGTIGTPVNLRFSDYYGQSSQRVGWYMGELKSDGFYFVKSYSWLDDDGSIAARPNFSNPMRNRDGYQWCLADIEHYSAPYSSANSTRIRIWSNSALPADWATKWRIYQDGVLQVSNATSSNSNRFFTTTTWPSGGGGLSAGWMQYIYFNVGVWPVRGKYGYFEFYT